MRSTTRNHLQPALRPIATPIRWCYLLFIISIFFENVQFGTFMQIFTFSKFIGILLAGMALLQAKDCYAFPPKVFWFFLAYLGVYTLRGILQTNIGDYTFGTISTLGQCLVLFWISSNILSHNANWKSVFATLVLAPVLVAVLTYLGLAEIEQGRETLLGQNQNELAFHYALGLLSAVALATDKTLTFYWRLIMVPIVLLLGFKAVTTGSRGAMLCIAVGLLAYGIGTKGLGGRIKGLIVVGFLGSILGYVLLTTDIARERWEMTLEKGHTAGRDVIFENTWNMFLEKPFFGWGPTTHLKEIADRENLARDIKSPHNDIMFALTSTGLAGGLFFIWAVWLCLWESWKGRRGPTGPFPFALMIAVFIMSQSSEIQTKKPYWVVASMAIASGALAAQSRRNRATCQPVQTPLPRVPRKT